MHSDPLRKIIIATLDPKDHDGTPHSHEPGQVFHMRAGLAVVENQTGRLLIAPQQTGWIPPGVIHRAEEHGAVSGWAAYLAPALCERLPTFPCVLDGSHFIPLIMERMASRQNPGSEDSRLANLARVFMDELYAASPVAEQLPFPESERLCALALSLAQNPADRRDAEACARAAGMSIRNFSRRFTKETGMTFSQWRQLARIYKSREFLARGKTVQEAAWDVGYESPSSYIAAFKKVFGVTPGIVPSAK